MQNIHGILSFINAYQYLDIPNEYLVLFCGVALNGLITVQEPRSS